MSIRCVDERSRKEGGGEPSRLSAQTPVLFFRGRIYCRGWEYLRWRSEPLTGMCARHGIALLLHHDNHDRDLPFIGQAHEVA